MSEITTHVPPLSKHLRKFGLSVGDSELVDKLADLAQYATLADEPETPKQSKPKQLNLKLAVESPRPESVSDEGGTPENIDALRKRHPLGLKSRSVLRLEFMNAGMGGCGTMDIGIIFCPTSCLEVFSWLDLENGVAEIIATITGSKKPWVSADLCALALKNVGCHVSNEALSRIENLIPVYVSRQLLRDLWQAGAVREGYDVDLSLSLFDRYYCESDGPRRFMGV